MKTCQSAVFMYLNLIYLNLLELFTEQSYSFGYDESVKHVTWVSVTGCLLNLVGKAPTIYLPVDLIRHGDVSCK